MVDIGFTHIALAVTNLDVSVEFYHKYASMHVIDLIRNVASYTRLMALGLAGAFLANVANELAGMTSIAILGGLIALSLHTLNFVIAVFSPTLHSLRLNFLEFFSTFYESGGREYKPFQRSEKVEST